MRRWLTVVFVAAGLGGCGGEQSDNAWLSIPEAYPHQVIESEGPGGGQIVIALPATATPQQALEVGRIVLQQAPADATVNARIYNDEATARNWRTVDAQWTEEHLWVVATRTASGGDEARWVGPEDVEGAPSPAAAPEPTPDTAAPAPPDTFESATPP